MRKLAQFVLGMALGLASLPASGAVAYVVAANSDGTPMKMDASVQAMEIRDKTSQAMLGEIMNCSQSLSTSFCGGLLIKSGYDNVLVEYRTRVAQADGTYTYSPWNDGQINGTNTIKFIPSPVGHVTSDAPVPSYVVQQANGITNYGPGVSAQLHQQPKIGSTVVLIGSSFYANAGFMTPAGFHLDYQVASPQEQIVVSKKILTQADQQQTLFTVNCSPGQYVKLEAVELAITGDLDVVAPITGTYGLQTYSSTLTTTNAADVILTTVHAAKTQPTWESSWTLVDQIVDPMFGDVVMVTAKSTSSVGTYQAYGGTSVAQNIYSFAVAYKVK